MIDENGALPDLNEISLGQPQNDSYGAICAMLTEHMVDADRVNRWLLGLILVGLNHCEPLDIDVADALETITHMSHADIAVAGFDSMNTLVGLVKSGKKKRRG